MLKKKKKERKKRKIEAMFRLRFSIWCFASFLKGLLKAFNCHPHDLLDANWNAHGLETSTVRLTFDYMTNQKQKNKENVATIAGEKNFFSDFHKNQF